MWNHQDKCLFRVKWLRTIRRWKRLNLDSFVQSYGFLLLLGFFWYLCFHFVSRMCANVFEMDVVGPILLKRIISFGFLAIFIIVTMGHVLTAFSSLFRGHELPLLASSPYSFHRLFRIQCLETLFLGGWVSGMFCIPIMLAYGVELNAMWWFYPAVLLGLAGFLILCGNVGILIMLFTARWIIGRPVRSTISSVVVFVGFFSLVIYTAAQNLDWLGKVEVAKLGEMLANLRLSSSPYYPSQWMAELMNSGRSSDVGKTVLYLSLLWVHAAFFWSVAQELGHRWYADAWLWSQEHIRLFRQRREGRKFRRKYLMLLKFLPGRSSPIIFKEVHLFARDFSQWGQLVLILALVLIYVVHTHNISFDEPETRVRSMLAFFNVILLGFIQATLSLRYTFPSISLEGRAFWTIKSSGMNTTQFFFTKYYLHVTVLLIIGEGMGLLLNHVLGVDPTLSVACAFVLFLFAFGFTSWSMGCGAVFHKFEATNAADVTSDTGALVTMILTLVYFGVSIAFLARFALDHTPGTDIVGQLALEPDLILYVTIFLLIQTMAILLPVAYGLKKLDQATV